MPHHPPTPQVFRGMQGLAAEVEASSPPLHDWRRFVYCHSMLGTLLGEVDHFKGAPRSTPPPPWTRGQSAREQQLLLPCRLLE
jgi:hypothetical protein